MLGNVLDLQFLNIGVYDPPASKPDASFARLTIEQSLKSEISQSLISIQDLQKNLTFSDAPINEELDNLLHNNIITMKFSIYELNIL